MKMKFASFLPAIALLALTSCGLDNAALLKQQKELYQQGLRYNDLGVATNALHHILLLSPGEAHYKDSLSILYFNGRLYPQAIAMGTELLESRPGDTVLIEMLAIAKENVGAFTEAVDHYQELFDKTQKPFYLYQVASIQFNLQKFQECNTAVDKILGLPNIEKETISISYGQGRSQKVPLNAACVNIKGVLALEAERPDLAAQYFQQAVQLHPEFELAQANLNAMNSSSNAAIGRK